MGFGVLWGEQCGGVVLRGGTLETGLETVPMEVAGLGLDTAGGGWAQGWGEHTCVCMGSCAAGCVCPHGSVCAEVCPSMLKSVRVPFGPATA